MASITVLSLAPALGAEVGGVDLRKPIPAKAFAAIKAACHEFLLLRFRGQRLSDPELLAFTRRFGELDPPGPNPYGAPFLPQFPEINVISNVVEDGSPIGNLGAGEAVWHADMTYIETPPEAAILHALEIPDEGGSTYFAH